MRSRDQIRADLIKALKERFKSTLIGAKQDVSDYEEYFQKNINPFTTPFNRQVLEVNNLLDRAARKIADLWLGPETTDEKPATKLEASRKTIVNSSRKTVKKYVAKGSRK